MAKYSYTVLVKQLATGLLLAMLICHGSLVFAKEEASKDVSGITYHRLNPKIITNLKSSPGQQKNSYVQVSVNVMGADSNTIEAIQHHEPYVRHILIKVLSAHSSSKLRNSVGQAQVRRIAKERLQKFMERENEEVTIEKVLFTEIIIE